MATSMDLTIDLITSLFLILNNAILAIVAIMYKAPKGLTQFYHIHLSLLLTWYLDTLTPIWLGWSMLLILSFWDLIAVLPKYGPLNMIIRILDTRGQSLPNALIYSTFLKWNYFRYLKESRVLLENSNKNNNNSLEVDRQVDTILRTFSANTQNYTNDNLENEEDGPKLGIGDFVFYSLLMAKTTYQLNLFTILSCFLSIIIGLIITMLLVACLSKPLPALPISIFLSIFVFIVCEYAVVPFGNRLNVGQIFI